MTTRARPGRPRHSTDGAERSGREDILDAAAELFVESGLAATSTRAIAERAGIRQASLYYHFAGKDEILDELLEASVRPTLEIAERLDREGLSPAAQLYALALADIGTLGHAPHNIGTLYLLPEVQRPRHEGFRADRESLQREYGRLAAALTGDDPDSPAAFRCGEMLIQLVEVVIHQRRHRQPDESDAEAIADACLRVCGLDADARRHARREAARVGTESMKNIMQRFDGQTCDDVGAAVLQIGRRRMLDEAALLLARSELLGHDEFPWRDLHGHAGHARHRGRPVSSGATG